MRTQFGGESAVLISPASSPQTNPPQKQMRDCAAGAQPPKLPPQTARAAAAVGPVARVVDALGESLLRIHRALFVLSG